MRRVRSAIFSCDLTINRINDCFGNGIFKRIRTRDHYSSMRRLSGNIFDVDIVACPDKIAARLIVKYQL